MHGGHEPPVRGAERVGDLGGLVDHARAVLVAVDLLQPEDVGVDRSADRTRASRVGARRCAGRPRARIPCSRLKVPRRSVPHLGADGRGGTASVLQVPQRSPWRRATVDRAARRAGPTTRWLADALGRSAHSRAHVRGARRSYAGPATDRLVLVPTTDAGLGSTYLLGVDDDDVAYFAVAAKDPIADADGVDLLDLREVGGAARTTATPGCSSTRSRWRTGTRRTALPALRRTRPSSSRGGPRAPLPD